MTDLQPIPVLARSTPAAQFGTLANVGPGTSAAAVAPASSATSVPDTTSSAWGQNIGYLFAQCQVLGLPLWTSDTVVYAAQADGGTGYVTDFAVVFGRNGTEGAQCFINSIIFDGVELISGDGAGSDSASGDFTYVFYDGTQTTHDPTIAAQEHPYTPAFIGLVYLVVSGYTVLGNNTYPQVIGNFKHSFVSSSGTPGDLGAGSSGGTGGNVYPFQFGNGITPGANTANSWWDWGQEQYYSHRAWANFYGDQQTYFDIYNSDTKLFERSIQASMLTLSNFMFEISPLDQMIFALDGHYMSVINPNDGSLVNHVNIDPYLNVGNFHISPHTVAGYDEIMLLLPYDGSYICVFRRMLDTNYPIIMYGNNLQYGTDLPVSSSPAGPYCDILDYTNMPSTDQFSIHYCCVDGGIGRIIFTAGTNLAVSSNPSVIVGTAFAHETDGSRHTVDISRPSQTDAMWVYGDGSKPIQIYCDDGGEHVYVIVFNETDGAWVIECYETFYARYNSSKPLSSGTRTEAQILGVDGSFEYFSQVYSVSLPVTHGLVTNNATNIRKLGQDKIALCDGTGQALIFISLADGSSVTRAAGDWIQVPHFGEVNYGFNSFPQSVIYDEGRGAIFYYAMSGGHTDFAGLLFLNSTGPSAYTLGDAFHDLSVLAGIPSDLIALSGLEDVITGMAINQGVNYTDLISQMASAFRVDVIETPDFGIKFIRRSTDELDFSVVPGNMVVTADDGHMVDLNYLGSNELPNVLQMSYVDSDNLFQVSIQSARRVVYPQVTVQGKTQVQVSVPIVMPTDRAQYYVGYALFDMWAGAITLTITFPPYYAKVEVGDVASITLQTGRQIQAKVTSLQINVDKSVTMAFSASTVNHFVPKKQIESTPL